MVRFPYVHGRDRVAWETRFPIFIFKRNDIGTVLYRLLPPGTLLKYIASLPFLFSYLGVYFGLSHGITVVSVSGKVLSEAKLCVKRKMCKRDG